MNEMDLAFQEKEGHNCYAFPGSQSILDVLICYQEVYHEGGGGGS
jgi:hypothetical protein